MRFARLWTDIKTDEKTLYCRSCRHGHKIRKEYWWRGTYQTGILAKATIRCPKQKKLWYAVMLVDL